ncbi:hypothetical protein O9A_00484 [Bartonella koehlerae C-29]|uniref:Uncharacterized protein n=1 Tax=Bartonella koehlerae C-29 TaxID=1134510 RepID=A0A067W9Y1_9HYPH|nr:hypothetical protein O9A_00484 [Bartonella koehlerae C-29]
MQAEGCLITERFYCLDCKIIIYSRYNFKII